MDWSTLHLHSGQTESWAEQIRDFLRAAIQDGRLKPGEALPPVRELAERLGVHYTTVARAYQMLAREGWVRTRRRRGTVVVGPRPDTWAQEALEDMAWRFVQQATWLGFGPEAILEAVQEALRQTLPQTEETR